MCKWTDFEGGKYAFVVPVGGKKNPWLEMSLRSLSGVAEKT